MAKRDPTDDFFSTLEETDQSRLGGAGGTQISGGTQIGGTGSGTISQCTNPYNSTLSANFAGKVAQALI